MTNINRNLQFKLQYSLFRIFMYQMIIINFSPCSKETFVCLSVIKQQVAIENRKMNVIDTGCTFLINFSLPFHENYIR